MKTAIYNFALKHARRTWLFGALFSFLLFSFWLPPYMPFFTLPLVVALSFKMPETKALFLSALVGCSIDLLSSLLPFGFYAITLSLMLAFIYSLEHFFKKSRALALFSTLFLTAALFIIQSLALYFFKSDSWLSIASSAVLATTFVLLPLFNGLITWGLFQAEQSLRDGLDSSAK